MSHDQVEHTYRGRALLAAFLWVWFLLCAGLAVGTPATSDPTAIVLMGLPALIAAYMCLGLAWGESVAFVQIQTAGVVMRLPRYRGFFPFLGMQRLAARWEDINGIWQWRVRSRCLFFPTDYILHRVVAKQGTVILVESLLHGRKGSQNLPVAEIIQAVRRHAELAPHFAGEVNGHGMLYGMLFGGPKQQRGAPLPTRIVEQPGGR